MVAGVGESAQRLTSKWDAGGVELELDGRGSMRRGAPRFSVWPEIACGALCYRNATTSAKTGCVENRYCIRSQTVSALHAAE
jgi:hypothetical protein